MAKYLKRKSSIPNPALKPLSVLIGNWKYVGKHRLLPDTTLLGHTTFEWLEGGAYLIMRDYDEEKDIPNSTSIFGSDDDSAEVYTMLYFDERGVSRIFKWSFGNNVWKWWRNAPGFSQRFTGTISDDGNSIIGIGDLSEDDSTWKRDIELTYTRVK